MALCSLILSIQVINYLNELDKYSIDKNYNFAVATIHPDNIYSINNFIKDGFVLTGKRNFKRGPRNIYVKKLINTK